MKLPVHSGPLPAAAAAEPASHAPDLAGAPLEPELALDLLHEVIDPELGVNIVDLGLVHDVEIDAGHVRVTMTLTTPGCPLGGYIEDQIRATLTRVPGVHEVSVEVVWDPPWDPEQMSDAAREQLGWCC